MNNSIPQKYRLMLILLINIFRILTAVGQEPWMLQVDSVFHSMNNDSTPGCAIAITKNSEILYTNEYGIANLEYNIPFEKNTPVFVASTSKQFTAFSIFLLEEQGKLLLDDDIRKYLPQVPDFNEVITIRHLIHHTSGLRDYLRLLIKAGVTYEDVIEKQYVWNLIELQEQLNFSPGDEFAYSNTNYFLLSEIIEKVTGKTFLEYTRENLFGPLKMHNSFFCDDRNKIIPFKAVGYYVIQEDRFKNNNWNGSTVGDAGLYTTAEDLAKWLINLETGKYGGETITNKMYTRGILNNGDTIHYAGGLGIVDFNGATLAGHGGGAAGYRSYICRIPEHHLGIVVISNNSNLNGVVKAKEIASILVPHKKEKQKPIKKSHKKINVPDEILNNYIGTYYDKKICDKIKIHNSDSGLVLKGRNFFKLTPIESNKFLLGDWTPCDTVIFKKQEQDKMEIHYINWAGQRFSYNRYRMDSTKFDLKEYEGLYYSKEIGTVYTLAIHNMELFIKHPRVPDIELTPLSSNLFLGDKFWFKHLEFVRDSEMKITGFKVTCEKVRNLTFKKLNIGE